MIPLHLLNRLRSGRTVSAEVPAIHSDHRAWVHVTPIIDPSKGMWEVNGNGAEPRIVRRVVTDDPIVGFCVRYRELHRRFEAYPDDWDLVGLAVDETIDVTDEAQLADVLAKWLSAGVVFGLPYADGAPF